MRSWLLIDLTFKMNLPANCDLSDLHKVAAKIALYNFQWHFATLIVFNSSLACGVNVFMKSYVKNVMISKTLTKVPVNISQCLIIAVDIGDLHGLLKFMKSNEIDNTGKYIIICQNKDKHCEEGDVVRLLWVFRVTNVVILNQKRDLIEGYTYLYDRNCENGDPVKVFTLNDENHHKKYSELFPIKFKNMYGCPLFVSTFVQEPYMEIVNDISGADGELLLILMKTLNATLKIMTPRVGAGWGYLDANGTWVGSLGDIYHEWANFSMTSASLTLSRTSSFEMSIGYNEVNVIWVSHPPKVEPASKKLLRPLQFDARIALSISFALTLFFVVILRTNFCSLHAKIHFGQIPDGMLFHCWEMCMGQPVIKMPMKTSFLCLLLFWIWYCYLIRTFYQVYLIDSLKNDVYTADIGSLNEYIRENYPLGGGAALRDFYLDYPEVYDNWINIESTEIYNTLHALSRGKKFVLAMNLATAEVFQRNYKENLYVLPEKIASSLSVIFFKKYSPLVESINMILIRLVEAGLAEKLYKNNALPQYKITPKTDERPIKLQHFTGCYILLLVGWLLSCIAFVVELIRKNK